MPREFHGGAVDGAEVGAVEDVMLRAGGEDAAVIEEEAVGDGGEDFLDVVGDHDERRALRPGGESLHPLEVMLTGDGIETGAGFVEDEHFKFCHESTADEHFLLLTLGERSPEGFAKVVAADLLEQHRGFAEDGGAGEVDEVQFGIATAGDDIEHGLTAFEVGGEGVRDETDAAANFTPVVIAEDAVADAHGAIGGAVVAGDKIDEGGLPAAIGAEDAPVLAGIDPPGDAFEDGTTATEGEIGDLENGGGHWGMNLDPRKGNGRPWNTLNTRKKKESVCFTRLIQKMSEHDKTWV